MKKSNEIRSTCGLCYAGCGILIHMDDGRPIRITGDPQSPVNNGILCEKARHGLELLYHPDRLKHPLRRSGKRGKGHWQQISWQEALDTVSKNLNKTKETLGPESVVFIQGAAKGLQDGYFWRFANVFGSPNLASQGYVCFLPRKFGSEMTFGFVPAPDYDHPPRLILVWGSHKSKIAEYLNTLNAKTNGSKLIVIDPRKTGLGRKADIWAPLRPGTDLALALGMIHVIVEQGLYDTAFVKEWTTGFDRLKAHVRDYTTEKVSKITWLKKELIEKIARTYAASRPAFIQMGNAFEHTTNSFQTVRALSILKAITGNIGIPGGELYQRPLPIPDKYAPELTLTHMLSEEKKQIRLGAHYNFMPLFRYPPGPVVIKAILEERPYPVRAALIMGANPLLTYPNSKRVFKALRALDFLVVAEHFMTPTALMADIVLPAATFLEFDSIVNPPYYPIFQIQQKVAQVGECWSDLKIINALAKEMDLEGFFADENTLLQMILQPLGLDFEKFKDMCIFSGEKEYFHFKSKGFDTPSGKVEIYSQRLQEWGLDPLPVYYEPPETPLSNPGLAKKYPLVLTSWKSEYYRHSGGRQIGQFRKNHPEPVVFIHPDTAAQLKIEEGNWVRISTQRGSIQQKAKFSKDMDPRVVGVDYAWWFPEKGPEEQYAWAESNINILTDDTPPFNREMGSANLRGMLCKVENIDNSMDEKNFDDTR